MKLRNILLSILFFLPLSSITYAAPTGQDLGDNWCSDVKMHFYAGGPEAGGFAGIVAAGAMNAIRDTGADAEIIYSEWDFEKMVRQLRESVGLGVDAIAMMGHPGDDALMPLAKQAAEKGQEKVTAKLFTDLAREVGMDTELMDRFRSGG